MGGKVTIGPSKEGRKISPEHPQINTRLHGLKCQTSASFAVTDMGISNLIFHRTTVYPAIQVTVWSRKFPDKLVFQNGPLWKRKFQYSVHEALSWGPQLRTIYLQNLPYSYQLPDVSCFIHEYRTIHMQTHVTPIFFHTVRSLIIPVRSNTMKILRMHFITHFPPIFSSSSNFLTSSCSRATDGSKQQIPVRFWIHCSVLLNRRQ